MCTPDVLTIKDLTVEFGVDKKWVPAVTDFNLTVRAGEIVALVGESGSGKSSTAMAALRLLPENSRVSGSVTLNRQELLGLDAKRMRKLRGPEMSVIFQEPMTALNPVFTIGAQITEALTLHREISAEKAKKRALELLELTEMANPEKVYDSYPHQLSGGQRQRAMIAQAMCLDPKLLIADEPTTALDVTVQAEILDLMRNLQKNLGTTIILITHDMGVVADLASRVVVMKDGRIVEQGPIDDIFYSPQAEYTQQLLEAVPSLGEAQVRKKDPDGGLLPTEPMKLRPKEEPVLRLRDVCLEYPRQRKQESFRAVTGANFSIYEAETVGLVGESGSGKTTIGRGATGLMPVAEGSLSVSGIELRGRTGKELKKVYGEVGMVFQDPSSSLNPRMPIGESVGEPLYMAKLPPLQVQQRVSEFLERIQIPKSYRNRYPHELSGGQKQRIGIARALILGPKLLVADEPTSALDVSVQAHILELMKELQEEFRFSCLFITHDLAVVDAVADRVIVMESGKIVEQGTREQILTNPREEYTRKLLSAVVVPDPRRQKARRRNLVDELITAS